MAGLFVRQLGIKPSLIVGRGSTSSEILKTMESGLLPGSQVPNGQGVFAAAGQPGFLLVI